MADLTKIDRNSLSRLLAEFLGTAILATVALVLSETTAVSYFIGTSVALALAVVYLIFSKVSGAHVNPALTLGLWVARKVKTVSAIGYIIAQLLGGLAAWQLYQYFTNHTLTARVTSHWDWRVFLAEAVGTLVLALGFGAAVYRGFTVLESALTYGTALFAGVIIASTAAAGLLNPAVALAVRSFSWVYVLGPIVGGVIGINLYAYLFAGETAKAKK